MKMKILNVGTDKKNLNVGINKKPRDSKILKFGRYK